MARTEKQSDDFLLGQIAATVNSTADDVKAIRTDVSSLAGRVGAVELRVEKLATEDAERLRDWGEWRHKMSGQVQNLVAEQHQQRGTVKGISMSASVTRVLLGALITIGGFLGWGAMHPSKPTMKQELSIERTVTTPKT